VNERTGYTVESIETVNESRESVRRRPRTMRTYNVVYSSRNKTRSGRAKKRNHFPARAYLADYSTSGRDPCLGVFYGFVDEIGIKNEHRTYKGQTSRPQTTRNRSFDFSVMCRKTEVRDVVKRIYVNECARARYVRGEK